MMKSNKKMIYRVLSVALLFGIWIFLTDFYGVSPLLLPPLWDIFQKLFSELGTGTLLVETLYSLWTIFQAMVFSIFVAGLMLLFSKWHEFFEVLFQLVGQIAHPLPGIAILPLVILWFGIGKMALFFVIFHAMVWPLWLGLDLALKTLDIKYGQVMKAFRISWWKKLSKIYVPGLLPALANGMKVAWSRGWRALISVEMVFGVIGPYTGLGWYLFERRMYMDTAGVYGGIFVIAFCGIVFENLIFARIDKKLSSKWSN